MDFSRLLHLLPLAMGLFSAQLASARPASVFELAEPLDIGVYSPHTQLRSSGSGSLAKSAADTFYIYGGPGSLEGKFEDADGLPDMQDWTGQDLTVIPSHWQLHTFNSPTGTTALWAGEFQPGWVTSPGYGNNWDELADLRVKVDDDSLPTQVTWSFSYNYDVEVDYDFCFAEVDSAGTMLSLLTLNGSNADSLGIFTPLTASLSFTLNPGEYVGEDGDEVHLRFHVTSDGGWSDEDGLWPSDGAFQVDDVTVDLGSNGGTYFDDFETGFGNWDPRPRDFAGDFAKVFSLMGDADACATNDTPQLNFIDDGTPPSNLPGHSTGGSTSATYGYGTPGGHVVNYSGGFLEEGGISNVADSPEIDFDLPGPADDAARGGLLLAFDRWTHLPLGNGMFYTWAIRSNSGGPWTGWVNVGSSFNYGGGVPHYGRSEYSLHNKIPDFDLVQKLQIRLGVHELADLFSFPGDDATPSPTFDNVSLRKTKPAGAVLCTRSLDLFQSSFAASGIDPDAYAGGVAADAEFAVRVDRASAINQAGLVAVPGDSISVNAVARVPGTALASLPVLRYRLFANPAFPDLGQGGPRDVSMHTGGVAGNWVDSYGLAWNVYEGVVSSDSSRTSSGSVVADRFQVDLPFDGPPRDPAIITEPAEPAGFFPGDWIHYYLEVRDTAGNLTTLPRNLSGYDDVDPAVSAYDPVFRIRGLPTIRDTSSGLPGVQAQSPPVLFVNDAFGFGNHAAWTTAWHQNGMREGRDYDAYVVMSPASPLDQGIGAAGVHGATPAQMSAYSCLFYDSASLSDVLLSDGADIDNYSDRSDDLGLITSWHAQAGDRYSAYFGDNLTSYLRLGAGPVFRSGILGVELGVGEENVGPILGSQVAAQVAPTGAVPALGSGFLAYGGCPGLNAFDHILPASGSGAVSALEFLTPGGNSGVYAASAGVWFDRLENVGQQAYRRVDVTFPFGFANVRDRTEASIDGRSARAVLLGELLTAFGHSGSAPTATTPLRVVTALRRNHPNPFNPRTSIAFAVASRGPVTLRVLDLRGRLVRTLLDAGVEAGEHTVVFDGADDDGQALASGVYLYELMAGEEQFVRKMALVR